MITCRTQWEYVPFSGTDVLSTLAGGCVGNNRRGLLCGTIVPPPNPNG
jgi:hypothetical protein